MRFIGRACYLDCNTYTGLVKHNFELKLYTISYSSVLTYVVGAQKNRLTETVLLSTHNICFWLRNTKKEIVRTPN